MVRNVRFISPRWFYADFYTIENGQRDSKHSKFNNKIVNNDFIAI